MNSVYLSLINLCVQCLSRSLSVSIVIWFPLCIVRNKCECAHIMQVGMVTGCQTIHTHINIYSNKHTSEREEIKFHQLHKLSEGDSLHSPIKCYYIKIFCWGVNIC